MEMDLGAEDTDKKDADQQEEEQKEKQVAEDPAVLKELGKQMELLRKAAAHPFVLSKAQSSAKYGRSRTYTAAQGTSSGSAPVPSFQEAAASSRGKRRNVPAKGKPTMQGLWADLTKGFSRKAELKLSTEQSSWGSKVQPTSSSVV